MITLDKKLSLLQDEVLIMNYSYLEEEFKDALYWSPSDKFKRILIGALGTLIFASCVSAFLGASSLLFEKVKSSSAYEDSIETSNISSQSDRYEMLASLSQDEKKRTNILLIGIPGEPWPAPYLTDSIQVVSVDPGNQKILITAIPRDLLVKIPGSTYETRINALYSLENDPSLISRKVKEVTGLDVQYYVVIDLQSLQKIIDVLGGVDINVKSPLYDPKFPTISRGYEVFSIPSGPQHLDGETAMKYMRSRHQESGDFGRIKRQQQVIKALKKKIIELNILKDFLTITNLFKEFNGETNFSLKELRALISLAIKLSSEEIQYFIIDAGRSDSLLLYGETILGNRPASVLWPKEGKFEYKTIRRKISEALKL